MVQKESRRSGQRGAQTESSAWASEETAVVTIESQHDPEGPEDRPPLRPNDQDRIAFHMAEFSALKSEIADLVKVASSNLQYALAVSGAITSWLVVSVKWPRFGAVSRPLSAENLRYAFLLPLLLSALFGMLALAAYLRIGMKGDYLSCIEDRLRARGLGWERHFKQRPRTLGALYLAVWSCLIGFDLIVAYIGLRP